MRVEFEMNGRPFALTDEFNMAPDTIALQDVKGHGLTAIPIAGLEDLKSAIEAAQFELDPMNQAVVKFEDLKEGTLWRIRSKKGIKVALRRKEVIISHAYSEVNIQVELVNPTQRYNRVTVMLEDLEPVE